jgi:hypothetical protein
MEHFIYSFRLDGIERFVIWYQNDTDGVLTDEQGKIPTFSSAESAMAFVKKRGLMDAQCASFTLNLDWISADEPTDIDCVETLNAWNFFADVSNSVADRAHEFFALDKRPSQLYDKVFWGNNLPAVTPIGERYEPSWSDGELSEIRAILRSGLTLFKENTSRLD